MSRHTTDHGATAWYSEHAGHGFDAHTWGGPVANVEFPNQEILDKIDSTNISLRDYSRGHDGQYKIELMQDCLMSKPMQVVFQLRLVRSEFIIRDLTTSDLGVSGKTELVCRYILYFEKGLTDSEHHFDSIMSKSVLQPFVTAGAPQSKDHHTITKPFTDLLIHLMLFCVASARKRVSIKTKSSATGSEWRLYDTWSHFGYNSLEHRHPDVEIKENLEDEYRSIDASQSKVEAEQFRKLHDDEVEQLKSIATLNVIKCVRNIYQGVPMKDAFSHFFV